MNKKLNIWRPIHRTRIHFAMPTALASTLLRFILSLGMVLTPYQYSIAQVETPVSPDDEAIVVDEEPLPDPDPGPVPDLDEDPSEADAALDSEDDPNLATSDSAPEPPSDTPNDTPEDTPAPKMNIKTRSTSSAANDKKSSARQSSPQGSDQNTIESLDFNDAPIEDVIRAISKLTGRNFILDPAVKGRISILAPTPISVDEAYRAFLSALAINGYTVVPSGKFLKVLPSRTAQRDSILTYTDRDAPSVDQMVTRIVKLSHISVNEVNRYLRTLVSKDGEMIGYDPTNSLIITDYASNIRRLMTIINELDKSGFEERLAVIPIRYAKAKELAAMIDQIINRGSSPAAGQRNRNQFGTFQQRGLASVGGESGDASLSLVTPDERTNSIVVLGNQSGIEKIRMLVEELDFNLDPGEGGGVFVYRLKHSVAEDVANTLNGLAQQSSASRASVGGTTSAPRGGSTRATPTPGARGSTTPVPAGTLFGGDVKIMAEKNTNSIIVVAGKQDYDIVRGLLAKIDVPRDQVYVEAIIMEINTEATRDWRVASYYLDPESRGIGRAGFSSAGTLLSILNPTGDSGAVLGFGRGEQFTVTLNNTEFQIPSLLAFVNFLQTHADANILSTPQIVAMDNEEAMIEVGDQVPIGIETQTTQGGVTTSSTRFENATIKLVITPHISPESNMIRLTVDQSVRQASEATVRAEALRDIATIISTRALKTNIVVEDQNTVVLGGLIRDEERRTETKVPLLGDIPVIGWLFKSSATTKRKINLLVFLTPKVIRGGADSRQLLGSKILDRKGWIQDNVLGEDPFREKLDSFLKAIPPPPPAPQKSSEEVTIQRVEASPSAEETIQTENANGTDVPAEGGHRSPASESDSNESQHDPPKPASTPNSELNSKETHRKNEDD